MKISVWMSRPLFSLKWWVAQKSKGKKEGEKKSHFYFIHLNNSVKLSSSNNASHLTLRCLHQKLSYLLCSTIDTDLIKLVKCNIFRIFFKDKCIKFYKDFFYCNLSTISSKYFISNNIFANILLKESILKIVIFFFLI